MKALKFLGNSKSEMAEIPMLQPKKGEVLVKIMVSALCGSERGDYTRPDPIGYVSGHEFAGQIVEVNQTINIKTGDRVTINVIEGCGDCYFCKKGLQQLCRSITGWNGGHGEYACVPESCCIKIPDELDYDTAVLVGGDTLGVAFRAFSSLPRSFGQIAYVSGSGPIGLGVSAMLKFNGYHVVVSEPCEYRRAFSLSAVNSDTVLNPETDDIKKYLDELTHGIGPDVAIECSGKEAAQKLALELVRNQGAVVFCGENYTGLNIIPSAHIIHKEITLKGVFYYTKEDFVSVYELYKRGLAAERLISHRFSLDRAPEAFRTFFPDNPGNVGNTGKVLLYRYVKEGVLV